MAREPRCQLTNEHLPTLGLWPSDHKTSPQGQLEPEVPSVGSTSPFLLPRVFITMLHPATAKGQFPGAENFLLWIHLLGEASGEHTMGGRGRKDISLGEEPEKLMPLLKFSACNWWREIVEGGSGEEAREGVGWVAFVAALISPPLQLLLEMQRFWRHMGSGAKGIGESINSFLFVWVFLFLLFLRTDYDPKDTEVNYGQPPPGRMRRESREMGGVASVLGEGPLLSSGQIPSPPGPRLLFSLNLKMATLI